MNRVDFDKAIQENDIRALIDNSFLARVPGLVASGLSIERAIIAAKEQEDRLCLMLIAPEGYWQKDAVEELKRELTQRIYDRAQLAPPPPRAINPRWLECEAALGHRPTAHEFIMWHFPPARVGEGG